MIGEKVQQNSFNVDFFIKHGIVNHTLKDKHKYDLYLDDTVYRDEGILLYFLIKYSSAHILG